jgi:prolyl oligopeptidase
MEAQMRVHPAILPLLIAAALLPADARADKMEYPKTAKGDVVDDLHGTKVADPYRWLEDDARTSKEVSAWIEAENKVTFAYLDKIPERDGIRKRLTELWNYERFSSPAKIAGKYYFSKNDGLQNQSVIYVADRLDATPKMILDPNSWSTDGTVALAGLSFSEDGRYLAYAQAAAGSDWSEWLIRDLATGKDLPERIKWTKFTGASWTKDGKGFFYSRFDAPAEGQQFQALNKNQKVYYHRAGTDQSDDVLVYQRPDEPEYGFQAGVTEDGRYLILTVWKGTDNRYLVYYKDLAEPYGVPVELIGTWENEYSFLGNDGPLFYFQTDLDAPRRRIIGIDIHDPAKRREIVPQADWTLESTTVVGNVFIASYLKDAVTYVRVFRLDGKHLRDVELPGIGSADGFGGQREDTETFYSFSSYNRPPALYRYDLLTGASEVWKQAKVAFNPADYEVKQVFYESKDKTRVPMFVAYRKGLKLDGERPTLLYGYGGFNISLTPAFSVSRLAWMEMGGVMAVANLRGGGEYGEDWHDAGTKARKQNVFDDFIAAAEWLIANKYTKSEKLAIQGGSNGGLLVGACMAQRPELFGAALPAVGVMDMLRFHKFTAGRYWVDDYGSADNAEEFKALYAYSPYHNLRKGKNYPATLITTADTDDRVVPGHSFKFAAALQEAGAGGDKPLLIRIETKAGHGGGKPTTKQIEELSDEYAFLVKTLAMKM